MSISILSLEGEFDLSERARLQSAFATMRSASGVIVDFTKAHYIDSTILACLFQLRVAVTDGTRIILAGAGSNVGRIFKVCGLSSLFEIDLTLSEARSAFASETSIQHVTLVSGP